MVIYNFKKITVVPTSKDFVDVVLSKTQRKTPTVIHKNLPIVRVRGFYMRKVKYTQQNFDEKINTVLTEFPRLDDIHPFYADLMNILYDRDHYKLALGQMATARHLIERLSKDYIRLLKFGDSLYRCKQLKRAALGRMCTLMRRLNASLTYLEQVRQHLARLPSIDTATRTLLVCGYPNVGKSSFINKVTRANVEVQNYPFTTKSLLVGHMDYKYMPWQVIDTPGILDHDLEQRNTIEMQAVTALAHLRAAVLYFLDVSEACGFTVKQQVSLFHNIRPLFEGKPLLIVCNKTDLKRLEAADEDIQALVRTMIDGTSAELLQMSTISEEGVSAVKAKACTMLLAQRVEIKEKTKGTAAIAGRIQPTIPTPRDHVARPPCIPASVVERRAHEAGGVPLPARRTEKDNMLENGGAGVYSMDYRKQYDLRHEEWKFDIIPEIMDGKNIADFVDPDIFARLEELDREEEEREAALEAEGADMMDDDEDELDEAQIAAVQAIRKKKFELRAHQRLMRNQNEAPMPRTMRPRSAAELDSHLEELGFDDETAARKRARSSSRSRAEAQEERARSEEAQKRARREASRERSMTPAPREGEGYKDHAQKIKAEKLKRKALGTARAPLRYAKSNEADRTVPTLKPKHLYAGKMSGQKTRTHR